MQPTILVKRVYEKPSSKDGYRILVDRLWPRGEKKESAAIQEWVKDLAPTNELRKWFGHDPERWPEFQKKYKTELKKNSLVNDFVEKHRTHKVITLVYSAKDELHNQALVLQKYLGQLYK